MGAMRGLLSVLLCVASAVAYAQTVGEAPRRPASTQASIDTLPLRPSAQPSVQAEREPKPLAAFAVTYTDDADSVRLPSFATRTTPFPTRFLRVGVEWTF